MSKILFLANHDVGIYNFRLEIIQRILAEGHRVIISSPYGKRIDDLIREGCEYKEIKLSRHGKNPIDECVLIARYIKLIKSVKPDVVISYTIKPNIYGGIMCNLLKVPYICNITGLGTAAENKSIIPIIDALTTDGLKSTIYINNIKNRIVTILTTFLGTFNNFKENAIPVIIYAI